MIKAIISALGLASFALPCFAQDQTAEGAQQFLANVARQGGLNSSIRHFDGRFHDEFYSAYRNLHHTDVCITMLEVDSIDSTKIPPVRTRVPGAWPWRWANVTSVEQTGTSVVVRGLSEHDLKFLVGDSLT